MLAALIDFAFNVVIYLLIITVVTFVSRAFSKKPATKFPMLKVLGATLGLATIASIFQLRESSQAITPIESSSGVRQESLSTVETDELGKIYKKFISVNEEVDAKTHASFWSIVNRHGGQLEKIEGVETKASMYSLIDSVMSNYQKLFYQDALTSIRTGKTFTSVERMKWEAKMAQERVLKNKDLMTKIAAKKPIPMSGGDAVLTSAMAEVV